MDNIVTFETAQRLKEAGFPQPEPQSGQFWYNPEFGLFVVGPLFGENGWYRIVFYLNEGRAFNKEMHFLPECVFAPTTTDILREMPDGCFIEKTNEGYNFAFSRWYNMAKNTDPAEAAAEAWLKLREKQPD